VKIPNKIGLISTEYPRALLSTKSLEATDTDQR